jgi:hypothetical protein
LRRSYGTALQFRNSRNETGRLSFFEKKEVLVIPLAIEGACAFAWRNHLLRHSSIREDDSRRSALYHYITNLRDTGDYGFDGLRIAAVAYLKNLDKLHDDRAARAAADQALAECLKSCRAQSDADRP